MAVDSSTNDSPQKCRSLKTVLFDFSEKHSGASVRSYDLNSESLAIIQRALQRKKKNRSMTDLIMLAFFAILLGGLGIMLITVGLREVVLQRQFLANAVPVEATILSTKITSSRSMDTDSRMLHDNSTTSHSPEVRFEYTFRGERFESDLIYPTIIGQGFASEEDAAAEIAEYKVGATTKASADASNPERACLRMEKSNAPMWFIIAGCLSFALLALIHRFL